MHSYIGILYEDEDILVINKPAGLVVHSDGRTEEPTVVDWILAHRPDIKGVGDIVSARGGSAFGGKDKGLKIKPARRSLGAGGDSERSLDRSGIVHRLDRETSGALLIAKNQLAFGKLKKQFQRQQVQKTYHAFVYGRVKNDEGVIDRPIARSRANPVLWSATRGKKGEEREAITEYRVLGRSQGLSLATKDSPWGKSEAFSFLELRPLTGRTHQLRVHLKAINYPIVCDKLYAFTRRSPRLRQGYGGQVGEGGAKRDCPLGFARLALHSRSLSFTLPSGKKIKVEAPYPADFQRALSVFESRN